MEKFFSFCRENGVFGCIDDSQVKAIGNSLQVIATIWMNGRPAGISSAFATGNTPEELDAARVLARSNALENAGFFATSIPAITAPTPNITMPIAEPSVIPPVAPVAPFSAISAPAVEAQKEKTASATKNDTALPTTFEEAMTVVVPRGTYAGKTMAELAGSNRSTVRWFATECNAAPYAAVITAARIIVNQWDGSTT